jgi:hypothetical protein
MRFSSIFVSVLLSFSIALQAQFPKKDPSVNDVPQEPVVPKLRSDLEDAGLRGKVRMIKYENESLRTSEANKGRQITRVDEFTPSGNKYITSWSPEGEIYLLNYYGYIDGFRVCKSFGAAGSQLDKLSYEYKDGKIAKETTFTGNGLMVTTTYAYVKGAKEMRQYDKNGNLTEKAVFRYDADGNETSIDIFETSKDTNQIKVSVRFTYQSFDPAGNWTQRSSYSFANGGEKVVPRETIYRTITYYSRYNPIWFAQINDPTKPDWELYGKRYGSVEGFWQMMLYLEWTSDERRGMSGKNGKAVTWKYTREHVAQMTAVAEARTLVRA